jgi:hypothetical protein
MGNLKSFLKFSLLFGDKPLTVENITYSVDQLYQLNNFIVPVHSGFNPKKELITYGKFTWDRQNRLLFMFMWLKPEEINHFKNEIMSGQLVPSKIHIVTDTVHDDQIKKHFQTDRF